MNRIDYENQPESIGRKMDRHPAKRLRGINRHSLSHDAWPDGLRGLLPSHGCRPTSTNGLDLRPAPARRATVSRDIRGPDGQPPRLPRQNWRWQERDDVIHRITLSPGPQGGSRQSSPGDPSTPVEPTNSGAGWQRPAPLGRAHLDIAKSLLFAVIYAEMKDMSGFESGTLRRNANDNGSALAGQDASAPRF
jgi:hypothetical protein